MKKILILIGILYSINSFSQSTVLLRGDTIKVYKQGDTATLKVEGEVMITHYKLGSVNDSVLRWNPVTKKITMSDASGIGGNQRFGVSGEDDTPAENRSVDFTSTYTMGLRHMSALTADADSSISSTGYAFLSLNKFTNLTRLGTAYRTLTTNQGASLFESNWNSGNPYAQIVSWKNGDASTSNYYRSYTDSLSAWLTSGSKYKIHNLPEASAAKTLYYDPTNGEVTYDDASSGSGTINSGTTGKPAYYVGATTLDDFAAVDYATSGTNVLITTQNTTDVGLNIKGQSSQSANYLNVSTSAGTADVAYINSAGEMIFGGNSDIGLYDMQLNKGISVLNVGNAEQGITLARGTSIANDIWYVSNNQDLLWQMSTLGMPLGIGTGTGAGNVILNPNGDNILIATSSGIKIAGAVAYNGSTEALLEVEGAEATDAVLLLDADDGDNDADAWWVKSLATGNDLIFLNHTTENLRIISTGGLRMPEISAPSTPASATTVIYPKSDGLWYGKDDAGVESRLSNLIQSKGLTLESPGSAEDFGMWKTQVAITVSSINAVVKGSSPSVTINIAFGSDITSLTNVFSAGTAITNTTTGQTVNSGFNDATIPAGSWIRLISTASSGTITQIEVTINYTED